MYDELKDAEQILKITASNPISKDCEYFRISAKKIYLKGEMCFQAEMFKGTQVFHQNINFSELSDWMKQNVIGAYKQICLVMPHANITYLTSNKGKTTRLQRAVETHTDGVQTNNRRKNYIINEGDDIPVLVDLGIFTKEGRVVADMYDKFKQINRFVEILDDVFKDFQGSLTMLDFGCGKSYLTFVVYHYLTQVRKIDARIIGYDLKADVVANCRALSIKYGYKNLQFKVADISRDVVYDEHIDAVLSLHACDTATDYALYFAVSHNVRCIFSVPCCQHEINNTIAKGDGDLDALLKYGIIKECVSALLTDSIRAMLLEDAGYKVDVMEFVDFTHSPKNIMIRCVKRGNPTARNTTKIKELMDKYHFDHTLYRLLNGNVSNPND